MSDDDLSREERKWEYERTLGVVDANTGGAQPALARLTSLHQVAVSVGVTAPIKRTQSAVEQGDLFRVGSKKRGRACLMDEPSLRAASEMAFEAGHTDLVAEINTQLLEVRDE